MIKNNSPLQALFEKGDLPGITQVDVINQAHPGYMQAAPDPNVIAPAGTNVFGQPTEPLTKEDLMNVAMGSGSPMAMGSVAKGGKNLLSSVLKKLTKKQKDQGIGHIVDVPKATRRFTKMRDKYIDDISGYDEQEFYKRLQRFEIDFNPSSPGFDPKKFDELYNAGSYNKYISKKWGQRSEWGQENLKPADKPFSKSYIRKRNQEASDHFDMTGQEVDPIY